MGSRAATPPKGSSAPAGPFDTLRSFFTERIWAVRVRDLPRLRALLYRVSRVAYATVRGFVANRLTVRAAALTYYSVLSLVPFLAFAFAVLKGLGAYGSFVEGTVRPYLHRTFGGNPALLDAIERVVQFVSRTDVSTLGVVGLLVLVYTSVSLLASIEAALNDIWGAETRRSLTRQVTDYVSLLVTTPLLAAAATTLAAAAQSSAFVLYLRRSLALGPVIDLLPHLTSFVIVAFALFAVYEILPNVRVRPVSALIGATVSALLWQGALLLYVRFQVGVASYNALYSALSALPVFLVWTYVSWAIVLAGAQVAASHQNERIVRQHLHLERADQALRETIAVVAVALIARDFVSGGPRRSIAAIAETIDVPPRMIEDACEALVRAGILVKTGSGPEPAYVPARDVDAIRLSDVRDALRRDARAEGGRLDVERRLCPDLRRLLDAADEESRLSRHNLTLRELAALTVSHAPTSAASSERSATS